MIRRRTLAMFGRAVGVGLVLCIGEVACAHLVTPTAAPTEVVPPRPEVDYRTQCGSVGDLGLIPPTCWDLRGWRNADVTWLEREEPVAENGVPLPPGPTSVRLALVGLATLGAWGVGRSARNLHLGHLPDWYAADPAQVGHATALDLNFRLAALPVCCFETPGDREREKPAPERVWLEPASRFFRESFLATAGPRAPPSL